MDLSTPARPGSEAPPALRSRRPGWRNPRLLLGVLLVAGSVVLGARLVAAADDSVGVWVAARDLPAGASIEDDDLGQRQVRFADRETADRYVLAAGSLPAGTRLARAVEAGELLPRAAIDRDAGPDLVEVPVSVAADDLPATVRPGSVVNVWVTPAATGPDHDAPATRVLTDVVVVAVPRAEDGLAPQATRQVIVGVPAARSDTLGPALGGMAGGRVVIARVG